MENKKYLCYQLIVSKEETIGTQNNIALDVIIRKVIARNKEEAIGKFVKVSNKVKAVKKLNIECFMLSNLLTID